MLDMLRSRRWKNGLRWGLPSSIALLIAALAGCSNLDTQQRRWIFQASVVDAASDAQIDGLDNVWIENPAKAEAHSKLHALWVDGPTPKSPVMLYLHGARRNVESSAGRIRRMNELGFAVLAIDYRGFGRSTDELPSEGTVDEDARAGWEWLQTHHPGRDRYIFGHSLGGAIAVRLASEVTDAKGLIVEGTFTSIPAVFQTMKWGWLPITPFITQRFDSADRIAKVHEPVLVVHGDSDSLILPELGRALYDCAPSPKRFVLVEGGTHYSTNSVGREQYRQAVRELFGVGA
jgi:alpha-beta hydrolase superfamily lysophospholipase